MVAPNLVRVFLPILFSLMIFLVGCGSSSNGSANTVAGLTRTGSFAVGRVTLNLADQSRATPATQNSERLASRTLVTDIYYPAARGNPGSVSDGAAPAASNGPFPLLVVAHGLFGSRTNFTGTLGLLASQGYVVAALDFPLTNFSTYTSQTVWLPDLFDQPLDLSFVIDSLTGIGDPAARDLAGIVDAERIGLLGHSFGGATVLLSGFSGVISDPRVDAIVALSPFTCFFGAESFANGTAPVLLLHGTSDAILERVWSDELDEFLPPTQIYGRIVGGDHMGFVSDPTRPEGERDLEFAEVVSSAEEAATDSLAEFAVAAIAVVPGTDLARCAIRPLIALPNPDLDPLISMDRQRAISDASMIAFFDAYVRGNAEAETFLFDGLQDLAPEMQVTTKQ